MTKQKAKLVEVVKATSKKLDEMLASLKSLDLATYREKNENSNLVREYLECLFYSKYIDNEENENKLVTISTEDYKTMQLIIANLNFINGIEYFNIEVKRESWNKTSNLISIKLKVPYGHYKEKLQEYGLSLQDKEKETETSRNAETQEIMQEVNTLLASAGLNYYSL